MTARRQRCEQQVTGWIVTGTLYCQINPSGLTVIPNGRDHVDHHRSLCLVISPYARRGQVSRVHTSIPRPSRAVGITDNSGMHGLPLTGFPEDLVT